MRKTLYHLFSLLICPLTLQIIIVAGIGIGSASASPGSGGGPGKKEKKVADTLGAPKKDTSIGSVAGIYSPQIGKTVGANFGTMVTGRLAGLYSPQVAGTPGNDDVTLSLRGRTPLVLIDGVPQSFSSINADEIESVTVLKDAVSTAMYGLRSANGIILITTKKGSAGKLSVSLKASGGESQPLALPQFLNAANYARLYNEALLNDGLPAAYSAADVAAYQNGSDPTGHPDVDWQKKVLRRHSLFSNYDLAVSGGDNKVRYFANLDYWHQQGIFQTDQSKTYNTNADYTRYILRANVDFDLNKYLLADVNLFGRVQSFNQPGATSETILTNLRNTPNNAYPVYNANGSLAGTSSFQNNLYGQTTQSGYRPSNGTDLKFDVSLRGNLDPMVKGMWVKALESVRSYNLSDIDRSTALTVYQPVVAGGNTTYKQFGPIADQLNAVTINTQNRLSYSELSAGYDHRSGKNSFKAVVMGSSDRRSINSDLSIKYLGLSGTLFYSYDDKYIAQVTAGYNGSNHFPKNNRYGFFPAAALGWVISKEDFMKHADWIDYLKLRTSYGVTGNDAAGYYAFEQYYVTGANYNLGTTVTTLSSLMQGALANPKVSWEKARQFNIGIDATILKSIDLTFEYFNNNWYDLLMVPGTNSSLLGTTYPAENIGKNRYSGFELQAAYHYHKGNFGFDIAPNISTLRTKILFEGEPSPAYSYMAQTGRPVGQIYGYVADGLFQSQTQADASPKPFSTATAGDVRYRDLNGDGQINSFDQTAIGNKSPLIYYGVNLTFNWKGFDLSALFQGVCNKSLLIGTGGTAAPQAIPANSYVIPGSKIWEFQNGGLGQAYLSNLTRWTPQNTSATYPRVTVGTNANNDLPSSLWIRSGNYLRAKSVELGYTLPGKITRKAAMSEVRLFVNGYNLFTATSLKYVDPEGFAGNYPLQRLISAGINVKF